MAGKTLSKPSKAVTLADLGDEEEEIEGLSDEEIEDAAAAPVVAPKEDLDADGEDDADDNVLPAGAGPAAWSKPDDEPESAASVATEQQSPQEPGKKPEKDDIGMLGSIALAALPALAGMFIGGKKGALAGGAAGGRALTAYSKAKDDEYKQDQLDAFRNSKLAKSPGGVKSEQPLTRVLDGVLHQYNPETKKWEKAAGKERIPKQAAAPKDVRPKQEDDLSTFRERHPITKRTNEVAAQYNSLKSSKDTAAGDLSFLYRYMKILDPGSTVREGEFATAEQARGVPESVIAKYNKVRSGQRLTRRQKAEYMDEASSAYNAQIVAQKDLDAGLEEKAKLRGLNPKAVFVSKRPEPAFIGQTKQSPKDGKWYREIAPKQWVAIEDD